MYKRKEASHYQPRPGQVKFRLLCNTANVGGLIGLAGTVIKSLERETSTKIAVDVTVPTAKFRLIHVIGPYSFSRSLVIGGRAIKVSPAQEALIRVFERMLEVEAEAEGVRDYIKCCLVVAHGMVGAVMGRGGERINKMVKQHGAYVKILPLESRLPGTGPTDELVQVANCSVSSYLETKRERFFDTSLPKDNLPLLPHKVLNPSSQGNQISTLTDNMNKCSVSEERNGSHPPVFPHSQLSAGSWLTRGTGSSCDVATASGGSNFGSGNKSAVVMKTKLEIAVREDLFGAVYGENDSNLTRLRLISGATVEVHDPSSGSDGKVIICGTRDQTLVAQSLLKAFLMSADSAQQT